MDPWLNTFTPATTGLAGGPTTSAPVKSAFPTWPAQLAPQQNVDISSFPHNASAHVHSPPHDTSSTTLKPSTITGTTDVTWSPRPNWPWSLFPHVHSVLSVLTTLTCRSPARRDKTSSAAMA